MSARGTVFLERQGYRQRRLIDALRLLPFLGVILLAIPLLWSEGPEDGLATSRAMVYIFGSWGALTVASALIVRRLSDQAIEGYDAGLPLALQVQNTSAGSNTPLKSFEEAGPDGPDKP